MIREDARKSILNSSQKPMTAPPGSISGARSKEYNMFLRNDGYQDGEFFKCRSIYFAAYLMTQMERPLVGTDVDGKKVTFLFTAEGNENALMKEFVGIDGMTGSIIISDYMKNVNKLKDIAKSLTNGGGGYSNGR